MCAAGKRVSLTIAGPGPSFILHFFHLFVHVDLLFICVVLLYCFLSMLDICLSALFFLFLQNVGVKSGVYIHPTAENKRNDLALPD